MRHLLVIMVFLACAPAGSGCATFQQSLPRTDDAGIASLLSRRLAADPRLCPYAITVIVVNRTARLEGWVSSDADRRHADTLAIAAGATHVEDLLQLDPSAGSRGQC
jgi:osmotically-inducible protein OsmY